MNLSTLSISRPVLSIVLSILLVVAGVVGYSSLGVRQFPDVDPPVINIQTNYTGANAAVIETQVTEPLEESVNGIAGIKSITSTSTDGRSTIAVEFHLGENLEAAANDVRDRVDRARRLLPVDADPPIISKADANSQAILVMTVQSSGRTLTGLTDIAVNFFRERLQTISGVNTIQVWGERKYAIRILMDPLRLSAFALTPTDVRNAISRENVELPSGRLEGTSTELSLRTLGRLTSVEEFEDLILAYRQGSAIRLSDVARVYLGSENERTILKRNGVPMVGLAMTPLPGANQIDIADEFYRRLSELRKQAPDDIILSVAFDNSRFIRRAIAEVQETLAIAFTLVVLIIFVFLRTWRATIIPVVAIPVSLITSFFFLWIAGFSINVLTLLGVVLATGLVVDDAIVMMENIYAKIESGMNPREAGERGASEIFFAIMSTTITLVIVFIPIIFLPGLTGRLFREFGVVVATSVIVSSFVSLSLTPMMSTRILRHTEKPGLLTRITEPFFVWLNHRYATALNWFTRKAVLSWITIFLCSAGILFVGGSLKRELAPLEDRSVLTMFITAPEGYTHNRMEELVDTIGSVVERTVPEQHIILTVSAPSFLGSGNNSGFSRIVLVAPERRTRSQQVIAQTLTKKVAEIPDARSIVIQEQTISSGGRAGLPVQFVIQARTLEDLSDILPSFVAMGAAHPVFTVVDVNLKFTKPEAQITILRDRARESGLTVTDITDAIQAGFSGQRYAYYTSNGKQYQVIGEIERANRSTPAQLGMLNLRSAAGQMIPLSNVVDVNEVGSPPQLYRYNRYVSATVSAGLAPNMTIADGIKAMNEIAAELLDDRFTTTLSGPSRDFVESSSDLLYAFILALVLVYLVLAAQFESWIDPLTIMLTVPLALFGGIIALWITGETLNIFSQIGGIVLIGLVTKNGILIVEFANQRRSGGLPWREAVTDAARARFRPILMTSLATSLGALPIALSFGSASGSRTGMGIVVVGGVLFATILTLFIIPALYSQLSRLKRKPVVIYPTIGFLLMLALLPVSYSPASAQTLTLEDAIRRGLENNYGVRLARADSLLAQNQTGLGIAAYLPRLEVNGTIVTGSNDIEQVLANGLNIDRPGADFTNMNAQAGFSWLLFDGLKMFAINDRLEAMERMGKEQARSEVATAIFDIVNAYCNIAVNRDIQETADRALGLAQDRLNIVRRKLTAGTTTAVEVAQAEVDVNTLTSVVQRQRIMQANARSALNTLIAGAITDSFDVETNVELPEPAPYPILLQRALERNPQVLAAEHNMLVNEYSLRERQAMHWPQVTLISGYQITNNRTDGGFILENRSMGWSAGLTFSFPLFSGGADKVEIQRAKLELEKSKISIERLRASVELQLSVTWKLYEQNRFLISLEESTLKAAESNVEIALRQYQAGTITSIEARQAVQSYLEASVRLSRLKHEIVTAAADLRRISGTLVE